jgi:YaiO family outer membrane protein
MKTFTLAFTATIVSASFCIPAWASGTKHAISASVRGEDFTRGIGSRRWATLEYRLESDETTLTFSTTTGERRSVVSKDRAVGGSVAVYHKWSDAVSTRTHVFVSQNEPVFARYDLSQDLTVRLMEGTALTVGGRYARFFGNQDVRFASAGLRQYFRGGSVSYRLSLVDPDERPPYLAHLVNLSVNDENGAGRTRLWLSAGEASYDGPHIGSTSKGKDYAAVIQRSQPIGGPLALTITGGIASYARRGRNSTGTSVGLGLTTSFGEANRASGQ